MSFIGDMFGKGQPRTPKPIQADTLIEAMKEANRVTEITPLGTREFGAIGRGGAFTPSTGIDAAPTTLAPLGEETLNLNLLAARDLAARGAEQVGHLPGEPVSFEGLPEFVSELDFSGLTPIPGVDDFSADRRRVEEATYGRLTSLLDPDFEREGRALRQRLVNRGIPIGSEAYDEAFDRFDRAKDETLSRGARTQGVAERFASRGSAFNELASLLGKSQVTIPQFGAPAPIDVGGAYGAQYQTQANRLNARTAAERAQLQGFSDLGQVGLEAFIAFCWVAREVYGVHNSAWLAFREWMLSEAPRWLRALYLRHGERIAAWLRDKPRLKKLARAWMDAKIPARFRGSEHSSGEVVRIVQLPPEHQEFVRAYADRLEGLSPTSLGYALVDIGRLLQRDRHLTYPQASAVARAIWRFLDHPPLATEYGDETYSDCARAVDAVAGATATIEAGGAALH